MLYLLIKQCNVVRISNAYRGTLINYAHSVSNMKTKFNGLTGFFNDVQIKAVN